MKNCGNPDQYKKSGSSKITAVNLNFRVLFNYHKTLRKNMSNFSECPTIFINLDHVLISCQVFSVSAYISSNSKLHDN